MKNYTFYFIFFVCSLYSRGQMILNQSGEAFRADQFFNEQFIKKNGIKKIKGSYSLKKNGERIRETPGSYSYSFDEQGRLIAILDLRWNGKKLDTLVHYYSYNHEGILHRIKKSEYGGITEKEMRYDSLQRIIKIVNFRVTLDDNGNTINRTEINEETFSYNGIKKITHNSYGLPYLISFETFDEDGYLLSSQDKLKRSGTVSIKKYEYDKKGYLTGMYTFYDKSPDPVETTTFTYDPFGNITERLQKKMNILVNDLQIIYDTKTQLLYSLIRRNPSTNFMEIIRFTSYEYFEK